MSAHIQNILLVINFSKLFNFHCSQLEILFLDDICQKTYYTDLTFLIIYKLVPKQRKCLLTFYGMHTRLHEPRGIQNIK